MTVSGANYAAAVADRRADTLRSMRNRTPAAANNKPHWMGVPVQKFDGSIDEISKRIPQCARRPFRLSSTDGKMGALNTYYDVVVRLPNGNCCSEMPVGVVSKSYQLVQHRELLKVASAALAAQKIDPRGINTHLTITENGERVRLAFDFPAGSRYSFQVGDGDEMRLRLGG